MGKLLPHKETNNDILHVPACSSHVSHPRHSRPRWRRTFHGFTLALSLWQVLLLLVIIVLASSFPKSGQRQKSHILCLYMTAEVSKKTQYCGMGAWAFSSKSCLDFVFQAHPRCPFHFFSPRTLPKRGSLQNRLGSAKKANNNNHPGGLFSPPTP